MYIYPLCTLYIYTFTTICTPYIHLPHTSIIRPLNTLSNYSPYPCTTTTHGEVLAREGAAEPSVVESLKRLARNPGWLTRSGLSGHTFVILGAGSQVNNLLINTCRTRSGLSGHTFVILGAGSQVNNLFMNTCKQPIKQMYTTY